MGDATPDPNSLHVIIIGAGLAGLSAAISTKTANPSHSVTILEGVRELAEIGVRPPLPPFPLYKTKKKYRPDSN